MEGVVRRRNLWPLQMQGARGLRAKARFEEGEKILCYEPDPKKVKILYEAKILEVNRAQQLTSVRHLVSPVCDPCL